MTLSRVAASSSVMFLRQAPGVAERKNFFGPFCSGATDAKALASTARSSHCSLLRRPSHSTSGPRFAAGAARRSSYRTVFRSSAGWAWNARSIEATSPTQVRARRRMYS